MKFVSLFQVLESSCPRGGGVTKEGSPKGFTNFLPGGAYPKGVVRIFRDFLVTKGAGIFLLSFGMFETVLGP